MPYPTHVPLRANHQAKPGLSASGSANAGNQGDKATNTSSSLTGAGGLGTGASGGGVDNSAAALKNPRKTDGPAHGAPGGTLHGAGSSHKDEV